MKYSEIICPKCKTGDSISFNELTEDKHGLNFTCHSCKISFNVNDKGGYLPSKVGILGEKFPPLKGLSFS